MVAGRRLWGHNEQRATQHQACGRCDLSVEAVVENRFGAGESRGLGTGVEAGWEVNEKGNRKAEQAKCEDDPPEPAPALVAEGDQGEAGGEQRHWDQQVGVGLAGRFGSHRGRGRRRQPGVARLADLDGSVVDELGDDQAGG
jgi:hypothetical protein